MHIRVLGPLPKRLPLEIEQNAHATEQGDQRRVRHDRLDIAGLDDPRGQELGVAIAPDVLVDGDGDEETAGHGLVAVDGVGRDDGRERRDLDPGTGVADDDDGGPWPVVLVAEGDDEVAQDADHDVRDHGRETHFGLADAVVADRGAHGDPVRKRASGHEADGGTG